MYDELVNRLRELQAITEHCGEQSCDECENRELCDKHDNKTLSGTYKEAADAIEELARRNEQFMYTPLPAWVSVKERLPERNTRVLVHGVGNADGFWGDQVTAIAERFLFKFFPSSEGEETWSSPWQYFHTDYKITHWMPLPKPPEEKDDR